jgi:hypothetical protein
MYTRPIPVEIAPHSAHGRGDDITPAELRSWGLFDHTDGLDAENPRKDDAREKTLPGKQLRAVQPERLDPDQELTHRGLGIGRFSSLGTSGPPGSWITAAFMVVVPVLTRSATGRSQPSP